MKMMMVNGVLKTILGAVLNIKFVAKETIIKDIHAAQKELKLPTLTKVVIGVSKITNGV